MARNSSGTYSLPALNPVVSGTTITTAWANGTMNDLATEITNSLDRSGRGGMLAPLKTVDGAVSAPAIAFTSEPGSGLYRAAAGDIRLAVLGVDRLRMNPTNVLDVLSAGTSLFTLPAAGSALLKGTVADGASAVGVVLDNTNALSTSGAKGHSFRIAGAEKAYLDRLGSAVLLGDLITDSASAGAGTAPSVRLGSVTAGEGIGSKRTSGGNQYGLELYTGGNARIQLDNANGYAKFLQSNPSSSTGFSNTLTPSNIVKAWAKLDCGTSPTVTVLGGFNIASASYSTYTLTVNIETDLADTNYAVTGMVLNSGDTSVLCLKSQAAGSFTLGKITAGAATQWDAADFVTLMVIGLQ